MDAVAAELKTDRVSGTESFRVSGTESLHLTLPSSAPLPTVAAWAHQLLSQQWQRLQKHVRRVLAQHPEAAESLHQIRVTLRRIGTWVQVFQGSVRLPKPLKPKRLQKLASALGKQRDLDVLLEILQEPCWEGIPAAQQAELEKLKQDLQQRRTQAEKRSRRILEDADFLAFQAACEQWLAHPRYKPQAELPLPESLPHLLTPLLAQWLLQPGWRIPAFPATEAQAEQLHELRKATKRLRYQVEFFAPFYGETMQDWIATLKCLQDQLGRFNDLQVLQGELPADSDLQTLLQEQQKLALQEWPEHQQRCLASAEQHRLYSNLFSVSNFFPTGDP
ncbi:CHAD domain-containing protein [Synechococcus sp. R5-12]|uniref:CHAD domain-containing protein n=1 Tax=Synechococcus sp. R5-12 TaxID=2421321 RepID=UPI0039C5E898